MYNVMIVTNGDISGIGVPKGKILELLPEPHLNPLKKIKGTIKEEEEMEAVVMVEEEEEEQEFMQFVIIEEVKAIVVSFWTHNTRVSPNKKDVCRKRIAHKVFDKHPVHLLEQPQNSFLPSNSHPEVQIHQRNFEKLKPYFVRKLQDWYSCCCITHIQMSFLRDAVNHIRQMSHGVHGKECSCQCDICGADVKCSVHTNHFPSFTELKCLIGKCSLCGRSKKLPICPLKS
ncbi:hypothetical protein L7F22_068985 [Adiantum nelumboides]|nr:hypothetical protein [Adiantum nelumboides]